MPWHPTRTGTSTLPLREGQNREAVLGRGEIARRRHTAESATAVGWPPLPEGEGFGSESVSELETKGEGYGPLRIAPEPLTLFA